MRFNLPYLSVLLLVSSVLSVEASTDVRAVIKVLNSIQNTLSDAKHSKPSKKIDAQSGDHIPVGEVLFLSANLNQSYIGELTVIKNRDAYYVELESFIDLFSLPILYANNKVEGWFKEPDNRFLLDPEAYQLVLNGEEYQLEPTALLLEDGLLYADIRQLQSWFDFELSTDYVQQSATIQGKGYFPVEQALARQAQQLVTTSAQGGALFPELNRSYQALSSPLFDLNTRYKYSDNDQVLSYALTGSNELAYLRSEYFLSGESGDLLQNSRLTFSRQSPQGALFGLNASEIKFGDIQPILFGERAIGSLSQGVSLTNAPLLAKTSSGRVSINGVAGEGWDIELYQNGILIDQKLDIQAGVFFFDNIELLFGENIFEVVKYGAEGQIEKHTERYFSDGVEEVGRSTYAVSINKDGKRLLSETQSGTDTGELRLSGRFEHVFSHQLRAYLGASRFTESAEEFQEFASGVSYKPNGQMLFNLSHQGRSSKHYFNEATARLLVFDQRVRFAASRERYAEGAVNTFKATLAGDIYKKQRTRLNYLTSLEVANTDGKRATRLTHDLNYRFSKYALGNQLDWQWQESEEYGSGNLNFKANLRRSYGRFNLGYDIYPSLKVNNYSVDLIRSFNNTLRGQLRFKRAIDSGIESTELGLNFSFDDFILNTSAQYDSDDDWQLQLSTRFSFGYNQVNQAFFGSKQRLSNKGTIIVRVFFDENDNGLFDDTETPLENVTVRAIQSYRKAKTDERGVAVLAGVMANRRTDIEVVETSFADPFMLPANEGYSLTPRAGAMESLDIPVVYSGEIEGILYHENGKPIAHTKLQLKDKNNRVVAEAISEFDGYYLFTDLRPGEYDIFVDEHKLETKQLGYNTQAKVTLSPLGDVLSDVNIQLTSLQSHSGYVAVVGQFSNLDIMKAYWQLVKSNWRNILGVSPFYIKQSNGSWLLSVAYDNDDKDKITALCLDAASKGLSCEVRYVQFTQ